MLFNKYSLLKTDYKILKKKYDALEVKLNNKI